MSEFAVIGISLILGAGLVMLYGIWCELEHIRKILDERNTLAQESNRIAIASGRDPRKDTR